MNCVKTFLAILLLAVLTIFLHVFLPSLFMISSEKTAWLVSAAFATLTVALVIFGEKS